jgi:hypothetical protein
MSLDLDDLPQILKKNIIFFFSQKQIAHVKSLECNLNHESCEFDILFVIIIYVYNLLSVCIQYLTSIAAKS